MRDRYEGNRAAQVMSTLSGAMAIIPLMAPSVGVVILRFFPWPAVFGALACFAAVILMALSRLPESAPSAGNERLTFSQIARSFLSMLSTRQFLGYQIAGSFSFAALFCYLSTVAYFLPDVFDIPTAQFGYAFAVTVLGFMTGSLFNARVVVLFGLNQTLRAGLVISLCSAATIAVLAPAASDYLLELALLSSVFFWRRVNSSQCFDGGNIAVSSTGRRRFCCIRIHSRPSGLGYRCAGWQALPRTPARASTGDSRLRCRGHFRTSTHPKC